MSPATRRRRCAAFEIAWATERIGLMRKRMLSLGSGAAADVVGLAVAAVLSPNVTVSALGVLLAVAVIEGGFLIFDVLFTRLGRRVVAAADPQQIPGTASLTLITMACGVLWIFVAVPAAAALVGPFDIEGNRALVGTVACVLAVTFSTGFAMWWAARRGKPR
jgi:hypothetical protein